MINFFFIQCTFDDDLFVKALHHVRDEFRGYANIQLN